MKLQREDIHPVQDMCPYFYLKRPSVWNGDLQQTGWC